MFEILSLFSVLNPDLSTTTICQLGQVVFALLAMTGRVSMLKSRAGQQKEEATGRSNAFSTPLCRGAGFAGSSFARICLTLKASISLRATKRWYQNRGNLLMVYRVFSRPCMGNLFRVWHS